MISETVLVWITGFLLLVLVVVVIFWCIHREMRTEEKMRGEDIFP